MRAAEVLDEVRKAQNAFSVLATYLQLSTHLFMPQQPVQDKLSVDYIVVGAGSSGAVIANRLTEDKNTTVLLLEAGGDPPIESLFPGLTPYLKETPYDWNFIPKKERRTFFKDGVPHLLQGKMLGGTSSLNYLNYVRGTPKDYDAWAELVHDDSWRYENLLKYFKRSEDLSDWDEYSSENRNFHGKRGYIGVTKEDNNATHLLLKAFQELGNQLVEDINGATSLGYTQPMSIIDNGYRQSTATYLSNKIKRDNLILFRNTVATKIVFDNNKTAIGIAAVHNKLKYTFYAKKEVIVAAGVINSPKLLMLSQIGPKSELNRMNIGSISDLPVGKNLHFNNAVTTVIKMGTLKYQQRLNPRKFPSPIVIGTVALDSNKISRSYGSLSYLVNSKLFLIFCAHVLGYKNEYCDKFNNDAQGSVMLYSAVSLLYPKSRGSVTLRSKKYADPPVINLGMFSELEDLDHLAEYIEHYMRVVNSNTLTSIEAEALYLDLPDTKAKRGSREYWKSYILKMATPFQSYAGTCSMGKVVDTELRVLGVQNLRVADASIIPLITSGSMDIPAIMIGEKAADLIQGTSSSQFKNRENYGQLSSVTITKEEITQYIQEIVSELQLRFNLVITELDKNGTTIGVTSIIKNINLSVREVEESRQIFLSGLHENDSYNITYIDLFVHNVEQILIKKHILMIKEIDGNAFDYIDADKVVIRADISYCTEAILRYIKQKRTEIIQRMTTTSGNKFGEN